MSRPEESRIRWYMLVPLVLFLLGYWALTRPGGFWTKETTRFGHPRFYSQTFENDRDRIRCLHMYGQQFPGGMDSVRIAPGHYFEYWGAKIDSVYVHEVKHP